MKKRDRTEASFKRILETIPLATALSLVCIIAFCREGAAQVEIGGYIRTDNRIRLGGEHRFTWNENQLDLNVEASVSENAQFYGEFMVRGFGLSDAERSSELQRKEKDRVQPWGMELKEAYIDLYGFITGRLDLRIGRQRIAWGTADKINPTDNLNPDDLEDPLDFGRKLGTNALQATCYIGEYTLTGVYIPVFTPAVLPPPDWSFTSGSAPPLPPGMSLRRISDQVRLPDRTPQESSMVGLKAAKNFFEYDFSLSYFYGRDDLPIATKVDLTPVDSTIVDVTTTLCFPRMQVIGLDMAGAIGDIGIWAEGTVSLPEEVETEVIIPTEGGVVTQRMTALKDEAYFKGVIGGDYTFKNGIYINGQYIHGFPMERGRDTLEDYFILAVEKKFLNDELKLRLAGFVEIKDFEEAAESYAAALLPEVSCYPFDSIEIILGSYVIEGKRGTTFGDFKKNDELYLKCKMSF